MNDYLPWLILSGHVAVLLFVDWFVLHRNNQPNHPKKAIFETLFFVLNALIFGGVVYWLYNSGLAENLENLSPSSSVIKYITGYIIELSLSVDNLFVIALIFAAYKIPSRYQHKLLFLGIVGAMLFRAILISVGIILVHKIQYITIIFGLFLLYTAFKLIKKDEEGESYQKNKGIAKYFNISNQLDNGHFMTTINGKKMFTALFGALITIEFADLLFALDSIPAVFAVTTDPFIVFSSNIFAIMGLRSLYFLLSNMLEKFKYLKYSVFSILVFVALKLTTSHWFEIPEWFSLLFIGISLAMGVWVSSIKAKIH